MCSCGDDEPATKEAIPLPDMVEIFHDFPGTIRNCLLFTSPILCLDAFRKVYNPVLAECVKMGEDLNAKINSMSELIGEMNEQTKACTFI